MTSWTAAHQVSLSRSLLKLMSIELVIPSSHLILCQPLLLPPSIFPSIKVFSNESVLHIRWPKYWRSEERRVGKECLPGLCITQDCPQFSSVQSFSHVRLFATSWTAAHQASLSITNSWSLLKLMSIESVMPSNHIILCHPLLLMPSIFPSITVFSNESVLCSRWPEY